MLAVRHKLWELKLHFHFFFLSLDKSIQAHVNLNLLGFFSVMILKDAGKLLLPDREAKPKRGL